MKNKDMISLTKSIWEYKAILFDVDGTLYEQKKLRFAMGLHLLGYFISHPLKIKELQILIAYRFVRERWEHIAASADSSSSSSPPASTPLSVAQYAYTAEKLHVSCEKVKETVKYWIHEYPLQLLPKYKDEKLAGLLHMTKEHSVITAAYSDYPAAEKLAALHIDADYIFCSSDQDINCMKPDPKAMRTILKVLSLKPQDVLMIGDRYSKDGLAAKNVGMDYIILAKCVRKRNIFEASVYPPKATSLLPPGR